MQRVAQATGAAVQTTVNELNPAVLGTCETFEEVQVCMRPGPSKPSFRHCRNIAPGSKKVQSGCSYKAERNHYSLRG